ncbi:hypothetical protein BAX51_03285 [Mycoplasmoides gallisepticum]|uniref:Uncharacterized protein n=1 Tax=Mycoplasmoides gallisepticum TaxID=2096 RepID=A0AB36DRS3_MYCGL|nr:hypothetical protein BAY36_02735 [Mycoplasmoides gallisepticum]OBU79533.1 hypothetical protein BAY37_00225 [Mycoplasmoides gallisepticum]OBU79957.1 hypothetical protein BAX53_03085 [Mycoplasmoides gallisepticum]OBU80053.1 hypothetical protein BAX52_02760 [Mycoplasmoides gallisepticum]OBU80153.1 hypothetical protein BAX51_03285 [Mycoplasmoides gallisepticum]
MLISIKTVYTLKRLSNEKKKFHKNKKNAWRKTKRSDSPKYQRISKINLSYTPFLRFLFVSLITKIYEFKVRLNKVSNCTKLQKQGDEILITIQISSPYLI